MGVTSSVWFRGLIALVVMALLASLGIWQLDRARQKRELHELFTQRLEEPALDLALEDTALLATQTWRATSAAGTYGPPSFLLDNRIRDGRVGYEVLSTFTLGDGRRVLVDRGWVPAGATRRELPAIELPAQATTIHGRLAPAPSTGIALGAPLPPEQVGPGLWRIQRVDFAELGSRFAPGYLPLLVYLDATEPDGYDRQWVLPAPDDGKHTAYAVQWFSMAGAVAIIFFVYLRRRASDGDVPE